MTASQGFIDHVMDVLAGLGPVSVRRMFGGGGVYCDGVMFALIADDVLYLKADAATSADFEAEGCAPFVYEGKTRPVAMSYRRAPDRLFDDPEEMVAWAEKALRIARAGALRTKASTRKAGRKGKA